MRFGDEEDLAALNPPKYENTTAQLYEDGRTYDASEVEGVASDNLRLDFYKEDVYQLFELYLEGQLSLEEFINHRNWPKDAVKELGLKSDLKRRTQPIYSMRGHRSREGEDRPTLGFKPIVIDPTQLDPTQPVNYHKLYIRNLIKGCIRSGNFWRNRESPQKKKEVLGRIAKLRRFMFDKMQEKRTEYMKESNIDAFKIYEIIMNIANETLVKLQNKNMIDSFDMSNFMINQQKSPVFLSDMNIRSKQYGEKASQTHTERYRDIVNLNKFIADLKMNKSTHSDMVFTVFNEISERYYKHLRPPTPEKLAIEKHKLLQDQTRRRDAQPSADQSAPNRDSPQSPASRQSPTAFQPATSAQNFETPRHTQRDLQPLRSDQKITFSQVSIEKQADLLASAGKPRQGYFRISKSSTKLDRTANKQLQDRRLEEARKERKLAHAAKPTFSSKMKANMDNRNVEEFAYHKEKKLLEYLRLNGKSHRENRRVLDEKIKQLETTYRQIDDDRINLLSEINSFNPLDFNEMKRYIEATRNYSVAFAD